MIRAEGGILGLFGGAWIRLLAVVARVAPGAESVRPALHRWRGAHIGAGVHIGTDVLLETSKPHLVWIGDDVAIGIRTTVIAHFRGSVPVDTSGEPRISVRIEDHAFVGPGSIVLPNVTIGQGAVVAAGSVVTRSVPPLTMVQGNPAQPVAKCGVPLGVKTPIREFYKRLKPIRPDS